MPLQLAHLEHFAVRLNQRGAGWSPAVAVEALWDDSGGLVTCPPIGPDPVGQQTPLRGGRAPGSLSLGGTGGGGVGGAREPLLASGLAPVGAAKYHLVLSVETDAKKERAARTAPGGGGGGAAA